MAARVFKEPPKILNGPPPQRAPRSSRGPGPLSQAIAKMKPGDWFYMPDGYASPSSAVGQLARRLKKGVICYKTTAGAYVCEYPNPKPKAK